MKELFLLNQQLEDLLNSIPKYERDNNIEIPELKEYNTLLNKFIDYSREYFKDQSLNYDQIQQKMIEFSTSKLKELLNKSNEEILDSMESLDEIELSTFIKLETCLQEQEDNKADFNRDALYQEDREFLTHFSEEEIKRFKQFQEFIKNSKSL